jgi:hypothetical protein
MTIKFKNNVKIFLGEGHMTKIITKFYIFFFTSNYYFSLFWGDYGPPRFPPPSDIAPKSPKPNRMVIRVILSINIL